MNFLREYLHVITRGLSCVCEVIVELYRSKALGVTHHILNKYDQDNSVCLSSGVHSVPGSQKELQMIIKELQEHQVFEVTSG